LIDFKQQVRWEIVIVEKIGEYSVKEKQNIVIVVGIVKAKKHSIQNNQNIGRKI